jgi:hypothetical protein
MAIEIVDLTIKVVIFNSYVNVYQRVSNWHFLRNSWCSLENPPEIVEISMILESKSIEISQMYRWFFHVISH